MDVPPEGGGAVGDDQTGRSSSAGSMKNEEPFTEGQQGCNKGQELLHADTQTPRAVSPVFSCVSMKSDWSMGDPLNFSSGPPQSDSKPATPRAVSPVPSCVSMKSDWSIEVPPSFSCEPPQTHPKPETHRTMSPVPSCVSMKRDWSMGNLPNCSSEPPQPDPMLSPNHSQVKRAKLTGNHVLSSVLMSHKASMKRRFESISEGIITPGAQTPLSKIYTELYITEGESEGVNNEHEVWQVESASRPQTKEDTAINCNDIFKPLPGQERHIRTVMTKGIAGIGKTVSVQKFILDWAEDKANQDVDFMFVLPFRELNLVKHVEYSLHRLLLDFHPELTELEDGEYKTCHVVFIFDGLDESRLSLNFQDNQKLSDVTRVSPVDVLMTSLIQGTLLPSALIWITSRPAAASQIPSQCVSLVTEVRGFSDPQKEEYFRKRIMDQKQADRIITHIKETRSLHILCHMPIICWIAATVLKQILEEDDGKEAPKTLTEMFIHFLLIQTTRKNQKYQEETETDRHRLLESHKGVILKLAELAFIHLKNGNLMFYEEDLRKCGIDIGEASIYSGMCTEIFREECVFHHKKVYCFVHLSIQEFLAALYVFASYLGENMEALGPFLSRKSKSLPNVPLDELLKSTVNKALESKNGHLDLFVRFLHGFSLESNQKLLLGLLTHTHSSPESVKKTIKNLKVMQRPNISPERCINLLHCLVEMHDSSIHDEIQAFLKTEKGLVNHLSLAHCSALAHVHLMSDEVLDEFDLKKYKTSPEGRRRLIPVVRCCRKALLAGCKLTEASCETVTSALQSANSPLRELDLSHNDLHKSGEKLLSSLQHPHCKLETLRLAGCKLTDESYKVLASAVQSAVSLTELDVGDNHMSVYAVQLLKTALHHNDCKLQTLRLSPNYISGDGCVWLAVSLMLNPSCATRLDLSNSPPEGPAQELLLATWRNPDHKVESLRLAGCKLTSKSCEFVADALQSANPLLELDLSDNDLEDSGVEFLSKGLSSPHCKLQILRLSGCKLTDESYKVLVSAVLSAVSLTELDVGDNHMSVYAVQLLKTALHHNDCKLQTLRLSPNHISGDGCVWLAFSLMLNPSCATRLDLSNSPPEGPAQGLLLATWRNPHHEVESLQLAGCKLTSKSCEFVADALQSANPLLELDLSNNKLEDSGVEFLSKGLSSPYCKLQILSLKQCHLSKASCDMISSVLQGTSYPLKELDMSDNDLQDEGVELLCVGLRHPQCKLETLSLKQCHLFKASCDMMALVLQGTSFPLRKLDMSDNDLQDEGVELLCVGLRHPQCKLETLSLSLCRISHKGCSFLVSALKLNPSYLKELDLPYNHPGDSGVRELTDRLNDPKCKLETLRYYPGGECRIKPGQKKYACELTLDPNTASRELSLSEGNRKVTRVRKKQLYPDHPDRFESWRQVLCREGLSGRCYWEAEWAGEVHIAVAYKSIQRKRGEPNESGFGLTHKSWRLTCASDSYSARHNNKSTAIPAPSPRSSRVGVYLDCPAGTLSFYSVSSDTLTLLHTFHSTFTQPLYPGFGLNSYSSVSLCQIT